MYYSETYHFNRQIFWAVLVIFLLQWSHFISLLYELRHFVFMVAYCYILCHRFLSFSVSILCEPEDTGNSTIFRRNFLCVSIISHKLTVIFKLTYILLDFWQKVVVSNNIYEIIPTFINELSLIPQCCNREDSYFEDFASQCCCKHWDLFEKLMY